MANGTTRFTQATNTVVKFIYLRFLIATQLFNASRTVQLALDDDGQGRAFRLTVQGVSVGLPGNQGCINPSGRFRELKINDLTAAFRHRRECNENRDGNVVSWEFVGRDITFE